MYVSRPYLSRLRGGDGNIGISRRLAAPDGSFAGVVTGSLRGLFPRALRRGVDRPARFHHHLPQRWRGARAHPYSSADLDADIGQELDFQQFLIRREGVFVGALAPDGVERLYTFDSVPGTPLVIDVAMAVDEVLAPWERRAMLVIPITLALFASVVAQVVLYRRETRLRLEVENRLERGPDRWPDRYCQPPHLR